MLLLRLMILANISKRDRYPMKLNYHLAVIASVSIFATMLQAEEQQFIDAPPPPIVIIPDDAYMHEELEPEITIVQKKNAIHEEHRLKGYSYSRDSLLLFRPRWRWSLRNKVRWQARADCTSMGFIQMVIQPTRR